MHACQHASKQASHQASVTRWCVLWFILTQATPPTPPAPAAPTGAELQFVNHLLRSHPHFTNVKHWLPVRLAGIMCLRQKPIVVHVGFVEDSLYAWAGGAGAR